MKLKNVIAVVLAVCGNSYGMLNDRDLLECIRQYPLIINFGCSVYEDRLQETIKKYHRYPFEIIADIPHGKVTFYELNFISIPEKEIAQMSVEAFCQIALVLDRERKEKQNLVNMKLKS